MTKSQTTKIEAFPSWNTSQEAGVNRYANFPTVEQLKKRSLFGIPLKSSITGQTIDDDTIQYYIDAAISELEHLLDITIKPVTYNEFHDYIQRDFVNNFAFTKILHTNIIKVTKVQLTFNDDPNAEGWLDFPLEFVTVRPIEGVLQLRPALGTPTSGAALATLSGSMFHALRALNVGHFPNALRIEYTSGFEDGKLPIIFSELINVMSGLKLLSSVGHLLFPYNSVGIGIDSVSQSVGTPGPQFLMSRLADLQQQRDRLIETVKTQYNKNFMLDYF